MHTIVSARHAMHLHGSTSRYVAALANEHGIRYQRTGWDDYAEKITELADDEVRSDDTENLLVALARAKIIDDAEVMRLLDDHWKDKDAV